MIELMVVLCLLGGLAALALVAIAHARDAWGRSACANHLRQLGLALASYHTANGSLPPAVIWAPPGEPLGAGVLPIGVIDRVARFGVTSSDTVFANWVIMLLPYLDQRPLYQSFNQRVPISHADNAQGRISTLAVMRCASDGYNNSQNLFRRGAAAGLFTNLYARGNYAINVGPDNDCAGAVTWTGNRCLGGFLTTGGDLATSNREVWGSGLAGVNRCFRYAEIRDGLSHTVVLDELRAGIDPVDPRGVWALGQIGASAIARHGRFDDAGGPNHGIPSGESIMGCAALTDKVGLTTLIPEQMACYAVGLEQERNVQVGARSLHAGGVQVLLCDGAARYVANGISTDCWHALHTRAGDDSDSP